MVFTSMQYTIMCVLSAGNGSVPRGGTAAAALGLGCCASEQRGHHCWRSYWCSQAFKTHATISPFRPLFWRFLLLSISLLCCLFCVVSQATKILFFRSTSRWSIGDEQGHRFLRFPAPRLLFNGAQFHSPEVRGFPRLLYCEQSVQQSR